MPTYDYECRRCGRITEVIHPMIEAGPSVCEHCGGDLRRVLYPAGIIFKGSGFYKTDSRGSSSATDAKPAAAPASDGGGSSAPPAGDAKPSGGSSTDAGQSAG